MRTIYLLEIWRGKRVECPEFRSARLAWAAIDRLARDASVTRLALLSYQGDV